VRKRAQPDLPEAHKLGSMKGNPLELTAEELRTLLTAALD